MLRDDFCIRCRLFGNFRRSVKEQIPENYNEFLACSTTLLNKHIIRKKKKDHVNAYTMIMSVLSSLAYHEYHLKEMITEQLTFSTIKI